MQDARATPDQDRRPARSAFAATLRWCGVALFFLTAILPVYGCRSHPNDFVPRPRPSSHVILKQDGDQIPVLEIASEIELGYRKGGLAEGIWLERKWYPYLLIPLWIALLFAASQIGSRAARWAGWAALALTGAIAVFEALYLDSDYIGFARGRLHGPETMLAWLVVYAILYWRPRGVSLLDVESHVSAQALLAVCHALTFPLYDAGAWLSEGFSWRAVFATLFTNYRPGFWLALVALLLAASPLYVPTIFRASTRARGRGSELVGGPPAAPTQTSEAP